MQQFGRETVTDINHSGRGNIFCFQEFDGINTSFGFKLSLKDIFFTLEIGLKIIPLFTGFKHKSLTFEELQPHICGTEVTGNANQVVWFCPGP